jgi:fucose permease
MPKRLIALALVAMALGSALLVPAPARADVGIIFFFVYCSRQEVTRFEPSTGETFTRQAWVCDWP